MSAPLLFVRELTVNYGQVAALQNVNLDVAKGSIVTVIGPNGAGKTTLLNALMGLLPALGRIEYQGASIAGLAVENRVERGISLVPERGQLFGELSTQDNLALGAYARQSLSQHELKDDVRRIYQRFPQLKKRAQQLAVTLSGGERQMLALGRALMAKPTLLMLDEPSLGLAPLIVKEILRAIRELKDLGVSILLVEQNARAALEIADYAYVLETGSVAMEGPAGELASNPRVVESYLGLPQSQS